ncbi:MAG TPA: hypothetical protein VFB72_19155, partial [Verrucomicrobiae bacterium]|nr:hypothetical protein [Verrucomicrobiae bacterium]
DMFWMITPSVYTKGFQVNWIDFAAFFGLGGIWMAVFIAVLKRADLLPQNDPRLLYLPAHAQ